MDLGVLLTNQVLAMVAYEVSLATQCIPVAYRISVRRFGIRSMRENLTSILTLSVAALFLSGCGGHALYGGVSQAAFSSDAWASNVDSRLSMIEDLQHIIQTQSTNHRGIIKLLGQPDRDLGRNDVNAPQINDSRFLFYLIHHPDSFDSAYFTVVIDQKGSVIRSSLIVN